MIETVRRLSAYKWLLHGFSTRVGGVSQAPHATLNIGFSRPDDPAAVLENRQRIARELGFSLNDVVVAAQVHGADVTCVKAEHRGRGAFGANTVLPAADALITAEPGMVLWAGFADCTPLLFIDPVHRAVGVAHAGWQGTLANIAGETVAAMVENFDSQPAELLAVIGPAIGPCCYEVDQPVIAQTEEIFGEQTGEVLLRALGRERPHLDLWRANRLLLEGAGLHEERIVSTELCTACHSDMFFSHRREHGQTGRFAALIGIRRAEDLYDADEY